MILVTGPTSNIDWNLASHPLHAGASGRASTDIPERRIDTATQQIVLKPTA